MRRSSSDSRFQCKASLKGAEFNWQHMFSNGFGFQANYAYVKSSLTYDNVGNQFALVGLSNSANLVGIYVPETGVRPRF